MPRVFEGSEWPICRDIDAFCLTILAFLQDYCEFSPKFRALPNNSILIGTYQYSTILLTLFWGSFIMTNKKLKTWEAPALTILDVDQTLSAGIISTVEGSWNTPFDIINHWGNFLSTPGGS